MQAKLYASNYWQRREEIFARANGQCENILPGGERCPVKLGDWRITRSRQLQFEQLIIHHPDGDPENPNARMLTICWACHMRLHRKPGPGRPKASARKQGYEVIRVPHLMELLATRAGFSTWPTPDGRVGWQIGPLTGEANDSIGALMMALHWLAGEMRDLQSQLDRLQEKRSMSLPTFKPTSQQREQDMALRLQDAEQRRTCDLFLRQPLAHSSRIAGDAAVLLNTILNQAQVSSTRTLSCKQQEQAESLDLTTIVTTTQFAYATHQTGE